MTFATKWMELENFNKKVLLCGVKQAKIDKCHVFSFIGGC